MKHKGSFIVCLVIALCLALLPIPGATAAGTTVYVSSGGSDANSGASASEPVKTLNQALALARDGDTIELSGTVLAEDSGSDDAPLVIDKAVTITGTGEALLSLRAGGILLGADVSFSHISIGAAGFLRPGIAANGHTLTLKDVSQDNTLRPLQIYGGTFFDYSSGEDFGAAVRGSASIIQIIGCDLDAVYAGSVNGGSVVDVSIHVAKTDFLDATDPQSYTVSLGGIYAASVFKDPGDTATAGMIPQLDSSTVLTHPVRIHICDNAKVTTVDGVMDAHSVSLTVEGQGRCSFPIACIDTLTVAGGTFVPLAGRTGPAASDITLTGSTDNMATLDLSEYEISGGVHSVRDFTGSALGILVLPADGSMTISGVLSGTTAFRGGGGMPWASEANPGYSGVLEYSRTYIRLEGSGSGGFVLNDPHPTQEISLTAGSGTWTTSAEPESSVELFSFSFPEDTVTASYETINKLNADAGDNFVRISVDAELGEFFYLGWVPLTFRVNGAEALTAVEDDTGNFYCDYTAANLRLEGYTDDWSDPVASYIWVTRLDDSTPIEAGRYEIEVTAPTSSGPVTDSIILIIQSAGAEEDDPPAETTGPEDPTASTEVPQPETPTVAPAPEETVPPTQSEGSTEPTDPETPAAPTEPAVPTEPAPKRFEDVADNAWFKAAVDFVTVRGLFQGVTDTAFCPDAPMTRGMLAVVLHRMEHTPECPFQGTFADVPKGSWFTQAVEWAAQTGVVNGYGDGTFGPDDPITREQLAAMLWRHSGCPESSQDVSRFTDADRISGYALTAIRWASETGVMGGRDDGSLDPGNTATRAEVAQMLTRYLNLD